jgi:hypothetical protein
VREEYRGPFQVTIRGFVFNDLTVLAENPPS